MEKPLLSLLMLSSSSSSTLVLLLLLLLACLAQPGVQGLSTIASEEELQGNAELTEHMWGCYFSAEYQGEFMMQVNSGNSIGNPRPEDQHEPLVPYVALNITYNAIPVWGFCHKRIDDKVLLRDRHGGYTECIRCFQLARRSRNIIEVFSQDLNRCYTNETLAIASCQHLDTSSILYRTHDVGNEPIRNEFCPLAGKYIFKYTVNYEYGALEHNNPEMRHECGSFSSDVDNCPNGSVLKFHFRRCSFADHDVTFECLGSWPASGSRTASSDAPRYIAFLDSRGATNFSGPVKRRPRYRCGLYHVDSKTGKTYLTLSSDSSCSINLHNSTSGYESFVLSKTSTQKKMPTFDINHLRSFPQWAQGEWEETLIVNGTMTFNDLNGYKSFTFVTVDSDEEAGKYIVFFRDQCDQEAHSCMIMKQRSENVLEFTTGTMSNPVYRPYLCNDTSNLMNSAIWWTLARIERTIESPCPITGQYTGQITDLPGMCAELSSNCYTKQIMYYKVYDCQSGELYEERSYLCLGQWEEKGLTYTYTLRNDTGTHECFVGVIVNSDEIYIKEAGDYCLRNIDPRSEGMRLYKNGECYGNSSSPAPTIPTKTTTHMTTVSISTPIRTVSTTKRTITKFHGITRSITTTERTKTNSSSGTHHAYGVAVLVLTASMLVCIFNELSLRSMRFHV